MHFADCAKQFTIYNRNATYSNLINLQQNSGYSEFNSNHVIRSILRPLSIGNHLL